MPRKLAVLLVLAVTAFSSFARVRAVSHPERIPNGATVHGVVTSVSANLIAIADGLITIDATGAKITVGRKGDATIADIRPGMLLFATVQTPAASNEPLAATLINATDVADATLFGPVESIDRTARTISILGRTIQITDETSFGGIARDGAPGLDDLLPGHLVQVQTEAVDGKLVATSVTILAPLPPVIATTRGTVKSIGADAWVINSEREGDVTYAIDAQTKIVGAPKVGDTVEVLYRIDSAHARIAIAIAKFEVPKPPIPEIARLSGTVKEIGRPAWILTTERGDVKLYVERAKIEPFIQAGDRVEVLAEKRDDGAYNAVLILRKR